MSANPHANGGVLRKELSCPTSAIRRRRRRRAAPCDYENTKPLGEFLRDVMTNNTTASASSARTKPRRTGCRPSTRRARRPGWPTILPEDADGGELAPDGRVMEMLSEHTLVGWLEGYLLTGRHGLFHTYEAFAHVIDSMFNQHAKWLDISKNHVPWRAAVASENILLRRPSGGRTTTGSRTRIPASSTW